MTPERRAEFEWLVDAVITTSAKAERGIDGLGLTDVAAARAALVAFVEREEGEVYEVVMVVNPQYPADRHYWDAGNVPTFPAHYIQTPGVFRVRVVKEGA